MAARPHPPIKPVSLIPQLLTLTPQFGEHPLKEISVPGISGTLLLVPLPLVDLSVPVFIQCVVLTTQLTLLKREGRRGRGGKEGQGREGGAGEREGEM